MPGADEHQVRRVVAATLCSRLDVMNVEIARRAAARHATEALVAYPDLLAGASGNRRRHSLAVDRDLGVALRECQLVAIQLDVLTPALLLRPTTLLAFVDDDAI